MEKTMSDQKQKLDKSNILSRRRFIRRIGTAAAALTAVGTTTQHFTGKALGANDRIGIGFIGCGGRSNAHFRTVHYLKTQKAANIDIVAACDVYKPRLQKVVDGYNAKGYMDHRELLADSNVDVVCISTPDHIHGYQAIDAVKAGKDVYCEKPVTHWRQFELTKRLAAEVKKSGRVFQLGTQGMSDPAWHQIKKLIKDGLIGQPVHAECPIDRGNLRPRRGPDSRIENLEGVPERRASQS